MIKNHRENEQRYDDDDGDDDNDGDDDECDGFAMHSDVVAMIDLRMLYISPHHHSILTRRARMLYPFRDINCTYIIYVRSTQQLKNCDHVYHIRDIYTYMIMMMMTMTMMMMMMSDGFAMHSDDAVSMIDLRKLSSDSNRLTCTICSGLRNR